MALGVVQYLADILTNLGGVSGGGARTTSGLQTAYVTGTLGALNDAVTYDLTTVNGGAFAGGVAFTYTGTWNGTVTYEVSYDGTTWVGLNTLIGGSLNNPVASTRVNNSSTPGQNYASLAGALKVRARMSSYTSGSAAYIIALMQGSSWSPSASPAQLMIGGNPVMSAQVSTDSNGGGQVPVASPHFYNGASYDRGRGVTTLALLASAARTATTASSDQTNYNNRGVVVYVDVTANPGGAQTLTIQLQYRDDTSGNYITVATSGAISVFGAGGGATGTEVIVCYPGASETAALTGFTTQALPLPRSWRVNVVHSGGGSWTYSVRANEIR